METTWIFVLTFVCWFIYWFLPFIPLLHTYSLGKDCKYIFKKDLCYLGELNAVQSCRWPIFKEFNKAPNSLKLPMKLKNKNPIDLLIFKLLSSRGKKYWLTLEQEECDLWKTQSVGLVSPGSPGLPQPRCSDKPFSLPSSWRKNVFLRPSLQFLETTKPQEGKNIFQGL